MEKELKIKVKIDALFEADANPNLKDWNEANDEERNEYVKNIVREFLLDQIDELMDSSNIEF